MEDNNTVDVFQSLLLQRLMGFGYPPKEEDEFPLAFLTGKVREHIRSVTNRSELPDGLRNVFVDLVCGEFLQSKKNLGQLSEAELEAAVQQVKLGDASVTFAGGSLSLDQRFDLLMKGLLQKGERELIQYRKLVW